MNKKYKLALRKHKWDGKAGSSKDGLVVSCIKCGCVKQIINGFPTYYIDYILYDKKTLTCDERNLKS